MAAYFSLFLLLQQLLLQPLVLQLLQHAQADPSVPGLQSIAAAASARAPEAGALTNAAPPVKTAATEATLRGGQGQQDSAAAVSTAVPSEPAGATTAAANATEGAADSAAAESVERLLKGQVKLPLTYSSILSLLPQLQQRFPHLVRVKDAVKTFDLEEEAKEYDHLNLLLLLLVLLLLLLLLLLLIWLLLWLLLLLICLLLLLLLLLPLLLLLLLLPL